MAAKKTTPASKVVKRQVVKRSKKRVESFGVYIYKVLKQVHPEVGISKKAMGILNSFVNDSFDKLAMEASKLVRYNKKHTLSSREV